MSDHLYTEIEKLHNEIVLDKEKLIINQVPAQKELTIPYIK